MDHEQKDRPRLIPSAGLIGYFTGEQIRKFLPCLLVIGGVFLLCGILIWPYLIGNLTVSAPDAIVSDDFCKGLVLCGSIGFIIASVFISLKACTVKSDYQVGGSVSWCYITCLITVWIAMICFRLNPLGSNANILLVVIVMAMIGVVISIVPGLISVVIGILARAIRIAIQNHR